MRQYYNNNFTQFYTKLRMFFDGQLTFLYIKKKTLKINRFLSIHQHSPPLLPFKYTLMLSENSNGLTRFSRPSNTIRRPLVIATVYCTHILKIVNSEYVCIQYYSGNKYMHTVCTYTITCTCTV